MEGKTFTKYESNIIFSLANAGSEEIRFKEHKPSKNQIRDKYPLKEGWLLQQDIKQLTKKCSIKGIIVPETKIPLIIKLLKKRKIVEEERAKYLYRGVERELLFRRLKKDENTLIEVIRCHAQNKKIVHFLSTEYYLTHPKAKILMQEFNLSLGLTEEIEKALEEEDFRKYISGGEKIIVALPELFHAFIINKKKFEQTMKKIYSLFPSKTKQESLLFLTTNAYFNDTMEHFWEEGENELTTQYTYLFSQQYKILRITQAREIMKEQP